MKPTSLLDCKKKLNFYKTQSQVESCMSKKLIRYRGAEVTLSEIVFSEHFHYKPTGKQWRETCTERMIVDGNRIRGSRESGRRCVARRAVRVEHFTCLAISPRL